MLTLVVHGTFAANERWWRLGSGGEPTFADRLEDALARRGLAGTVWRPALERGRDYGAFAWTGKNRHEDRVEAGRRLSAELGALARPRPAVRHARVLRVECEGGHGWLLLLAAAAVIAYGWIFWLLAYLADLA